MSTQQLTSDQASKASSPSRPRSRSLIATAECFAIAASTSRPLVGKVPYENVWGLLVDDDTQLEDAGSGAARTGRADGQRTGRPPGGDGAAFAARWKLGKLIEISDEQAREDLGRLSAQMMSIVARSARARRREDGRRFRTRSSHAGRPRPEKFLPALARRGRPASRKGDRHVLDLHGRARPERIDVHRARRRLDRRRLRRARSRRRSARFPARCTAARPRT